MQLSFCVLFALLVLLVTPPEAAAHQGDPDQKMFQALFERWTAAFNRKDLAGSCSLFAQNVTADYQGIPKKDFKSIRDGFQKIFGEKDRKYQYRFKLHKVYRSDRLAAVRITWYLDITDKTNNTSTVEDQGLDVFERGKDGQWRIVNYVAYPEKKNED